MAIIYGPWSNGLQVGIDFTYTPSSPTPSDGSLDCVAAVYVNGGDSGQAWNDRQRVVVKVTFPDYVNAREEFTYQYTGTAPLKVGELKFKRPIFYGQKSSVSLWAKVYDAHRGARPSIQHTFKVPQRPQDVPGRPFMREVTDISFGNQDSPLDPADIQGDSNALLRWDLNGLNAPGDYVRYNLQIWHEDTPFSDPSGAVFESTGDATFNRPWDEYLDEYGSGGPVKHRTWQIDHAVFYKARASMRNAVGDSAWSNVVHFQGPIVPPQDVDATPTPGITTVSATATVVDDGGDPVTAYQWQISTENVASADESQWVETETNSYLFEGLTRDTDYYVLIRGVNDYGVGPYGAFPVTTLPTVPDAPESLTVADTGADEVTVTWLAPLDNGGDPVSGYRVEWSTDPSFGVLTGSADLGVVFSYVASATLPGKYFFRVRAVNVNGNGFWSPSLSNIPSVPIRYWDGTEWLARRLMVYTADGWIEPSGLFYWNGATWVEVT